MIFCVKRLRDFLLLRGCVIFLTHSQFFFVIFLVIFFWLNYFGENFLVNKFFDEIFFLVTTGTTVITVTTVTTVTTVSTFTIVTTATTVTTVS